MSEGCRNCYAERVAARFSGEGEPYEGLAHMTAKGPAWTGKVVLVEHMLDQPRRWKKPRRIFVNSMSDLFHDHVEPEWTAAIVEEMRRAPQHRFQVLTKRPETMADVLTAHPEYLLPHVWWGTSVENQDVARERLEPLCVIPSRNLWVSAEPLIGPLSLAPWLRGDGRSGDAEWKPGIGWVVAGGESGPGARAMLPGWARDLRDECAAARVPFLFKQWGEWGPGIKGEQRGLVRLGKREAGRELDGVTHDGYPDGMVV
jgi:protein gp37